MNPESDLVRDVLNSICTIEFRTDEPGEDRLLLRQRAKWFVWSTAFKTPRVIGPLKAAWKDSDGNIWLETKEVDDMMSLVEDLYGEKGIHGMPDAERGIAPSGEIPDEVYNFLRVVSILKDCESRIAEISAKSGVPLKILYDGGAGVTTFRIGAQVVSPPSDKEALRLRFLMVASVLKEAYKEVACIVWPDPRPEW
jgi:hypothetical protein